MYSGTSLIWTILMTDQSVLNREVSLISEVVRYTQMWHYGQIVVSLISGVFL